jgi:fatty acid desaturase
LQDADRAFATLRRSIVAAGLLERDYVYYVWRGGVSFLILLVGVALARVAPPAAAVLIAFGSVQVTLIGHDAGHLGVFNSHKANVTLGSLCWSLAVGISFWYWNDRHTRHHASTNDIVRDPDLQWEFGPAFTPLMAFTFRFEGWRYAFRELRGARRNTECALLAVSMLAWLAPTFVFGWVWLPLYVVSQVMASFYLAGVVATNHIGMPVWPADAPRTFLDRQVGGSRNVRPHPITDFVFGGLNYQIEHHLFPSMPRSHFSAARAMVRPFCAEHGLTYTECGVVEVYRVLLAELPRLGHPEPA